MKLSVIAPTLNEAANVRRLVDALTASLQGIDYEILIVDDDSPDLTWQVAEEVARSDARVRVLRRLDKPGLGFAVIDGFAAASGEAVACIDADLQHDPTVLPAMLDAVREGSDMAVGCRYTSGGGTADWSRYRRFKSWVATKLAQWTLRVELKDPMSGYFVMRRDDFLRVRDRVDGHGFKILLEIVAKLRPQHIAEIPYTFRARVAGTSKLTTRVVFLYVRQLWRLRRSGGMHGFKAKTASQGAK